MRRQLSEVLNPNKITNAPARPNGTAAPTEEFGAAKKLPPGFADELFHFEMEVEKDPVDIDVVNQLLKLYATAIEVYESQKNDRYLIFKNKTHQLLMRPNVTRAMNIALEVKQKAVEQQQNAKKAPPSPQNQNILGLDANKTPTPLQKKIIAMQEAELRKKQLEIEEEEKRRFQRSQKIKEIKIKMQQIHHQFDNEGLQQIFDQHRLEKDHFCRLVQRDVKMQHENILQRLAKRKRRKQKRRLSEGHIQCGDQLQQSQHQHARAPQNGPGEEYDSSQALATEPIAEYNEELEESPMRRSNGRPLFAKADAHKPDFGLAQIDFQTGNKVRKPVAKVDLLSGDDNEDASGGGRIAENGEDEDGPIRPEDLLASHTQDASPNRRPSFSLEHQSSSDGSSLSSNNTPLKAPAEDGTAQANGNGDSAPHRKGSSSSKKRSSGKRSSQSTRNSDAKSFNFSVIPF